MAGRNVLVGVFFSLLAPGWAGVALAEKAEKAGARGLLGRSLPFHTSRLSLGLPCSPLLSRGPFDKDASYFSSSTTTTLKHSSSSLRVVPLASIDLSCSNASLHTRAATPFPPLSLPRSDPLFRPFVAHPSTRPTRKQNNHGHPSETGQEVQESADFGQEERPGGEGWVGWGGRIERGRAAGWSSSGTQAGRKPPHTLCFLLLSRPRG